jgi:CBS-domain-containing membrane protein
VDQGVPERGWRRLRGATPAQVALAGIGTTLAVLAMEFGARLVGSPYWMVPFLTSIATVMALPDAAPAQPRALVGGHVVASLVGYAVLAAAGSSPLAAAIAVGLAVAAMLVTRTLHPPAAIDPFLVVTQGLGAPFLIETVVLGSLLLTGFAVVWHRLACGRAWPRRA